ncbi:MAG: hypothetical protein LC749_06675, partial [Actinobacteria bacterium]|nr:hypothetical protein [Actinomycetota bacterium]
VAGLLTYAGTRIRAAHQPEPPLPGDPAPALSPRSPGPAPTRPNPLASEVTAVVRAPREEPRRPPGWLTAPRADRADRADRAEEQLTIPLEQEDE